MLLCVEIWAYGGRKYEINSYYSLPEDAWRYELSWLSGQPGSGPYLAVVIPDATPEDGEFTSQGDDHAYVRVVGGQTPWVILNQFLELVSEEADDGEDGEEEAVAAEAPVVESGEAPWVHEDRYFDVAVIKQGDNGYPRCELYETVDGRRGENYLEVRGDATVEVDALVLVAHGESTIPWPVFRRFVDTVESGGKP